MALSEIWRDFVKQYRADGHFQYFPHAHVETPDFPATFSVLATFDGKTWDDEQVTTALREAGLTKAKGRRAGARMLRKAMENVGLCWFEDQILRITATGNLLLNGANRFEIFERLLWRYQLDNPINEGAKGFSIFPHRALLQILLACNLRISRDEFILFAGRNRTETDVPKSIQQIQQWRKLDEKIQDEIISKLGGEFKTRQVDTSYVLGFHDCAPYLDRFSD